MLGSDAILHQTDVELAHLLALCNLVVRWVFSRKFILDEQAKFVVVVLLMPVDAPDQIGQDLFSSHVIDCPESVRVHRGKQLLDLVYAKEAGLGPFFEV